MTITLNVKNRTKGEKLKSDLGVDLMPAIMYGHNAASTPLFIDKIEFKKALKQAGENAIITLTGDQKESVLIHDVQMHPVAYEPIHADLYIVAKGQKVNLDIPLQFVGDAPALKLGGNVVKVMQDLSVEIDPSLAPHHIEVDLSKLVDLQSNITVGDLTLPKGATLYHVHADDVVVSVVSQSDEDLSADVATVDMENIASSVEKGKKEEVAE